MIPGDIKFLSEPVSNVKQAVGDMGDVNVMCDVDIRGVSISLNNKLRIREREADAC